MFEDEQYEEIKKEIEKCKYLEKILEEISQRESELRDLV